MTGYIEVKIKSDDDGHEYLIPAELESRFDKVMSNTNDKEWLSDDWYISNEIFINEFDKYMIDDYPALYVTSKYFE